MILFVSISRILQADNIGIYSYTYSVVTTFVLFGSLGTATYGQKEIAAAGDDKKLVSKTFLEINTVKLIAMGLALIVYMCMSLLSTTNRIYYLVQIPYLISAALDMGGIAENFVPWFFGEGFTKVTVIIYAFCPLYFFLGICTCIGTHILTPGGWQSKSNIGQVLGAIANLILNAILIPKFLSVGAAIASTSTELLIMIVYLYYSKEFIRWRDICRISMKYFIASIVMFIPLFIISRKLPSSIINTMILVGIGAAIYIVMLFVIRASITDNIKVVIRSKLERSLQE